MSAALDYMQLCRLCLVKDKVNVPIFGETSDVRQIFLKISACLPVKVSQDDNLPKNICDACLYKVDLLYQFWNTTVNAEKQLIQWLAEIGVDVNIKNTNMPQLRMMPQSHAHPHSMPETIILKEERPDPEIKVVEHGVQNFQIETQPSLYSGFENPYQPQVKMTVGAPTDFTQPTEAPAEEEVKVPQQQAQPTKPTPAKRRGRPPKQKNSPPPKIAPAPAATTKESPTPPSTTGTGSKRRSSAAAAAAAVAAAAADASSDESDPDDRFGDDSDDDMDGRIAKEEADSDEDYVDNPESLEPTAFVGVPSTSAGDSDQPGPSGLSGGKKSSALPANAANESGPQLQLMEPAPGYQIIGFVPVHVLQNPYCCKICGDRFPNAARLRTHRHKHYISDKPCKTCGKLFKTEYQVKLHIKSVHEKVYSFECDLCEKAFSTKCSLQSHLRRHKKDYSIKCSECDRSFYNNVEFENHTKKVHRGVRFICFPCDKAFRDEHYLKTHRRDKHDPYYKPEEQTCPECGLKFPSIDVFKRHVKQHSATGFICDVCGKVVSTRDSLKSHKMIHSGAKPFVCHSCGKAFNKKTLLKIHTLTHTKEKPHKCTVCGKCFSQRSPLTIHMRYHTGERPYACNICDKAFVSRNLMKIHSKVHGTALADMNK